MTRNGYDYIEFMKIVPYSEKIWHNLVLHLDLAQICTDIC